MSQMRHSYIDTGSTKLRQMSTEKNISEGNDHE